MRWLPLFALTLALGCGGDGMNGGSDAGADDGTFTGTVTYDGTGTGLLTVGVFDSTPPRGAPIRFFVVNEPTFPLEYTITGVLPGTYYLGAIFDVGGNNPTIPGSEDPVFFPPEAHVVSAGSTFDIDVTLTDPE
ncbi:MAG: hypothetical protein H6721_15590 [Sandaracinus sp.]|nr:hypothetical protein [Sandaracinus sp.]MCB9617667.1 hypothetical protein [Sandaracinus sp.]MCB9633539.1 hypothetical protein [Sandaracinus sp.]